MRLILLSCILWTCLLPAALGQEMALPSTGASAQAAPASPTSLKPALFEGAADPTGALVKRIDFSLPPFHGLVSALALTYHSRLGDGPLGVGWSLAGLSTVQIASPGKGIASFDGRTDVYLLDGELLHPCVAGTPSPSCRYPTTAGSFAYYFTDIERYKRIGHDAVNGSWSVWLQTGTRLAYTERTLTAGGATSSWLLATITDTSGNQVVYRYTPAAPGQARLPASMQYGQTQVSFHYASRPYDLSYGVGGATVVADDRRLVTIDEQTNGSRLRAYALDYAESKATGRSLLAAVQEFGRDATLDAAGLVDKAASPSSLPPTSLHYKSDPDGDKPQSLQLAPFDSAAGYTTRFAQDRGEARLMVHAEAIFGGPAIRDMTLDLNGDGLTDHVIMTYDPNAHSGDTAGAYPATFQAYLTRPGGKLKRLAPFTYPIINPAEAAVQLQVADVDGDHRPEIVVIEYLGLPTPHLETVTLFFDAEAEVFTHAVVDRTLAGVVPNGHFAFSIDARDLPLNVPIAWGAQVFVGDVNGDGYADLVLVNPEGPERRYTLYVALGRGDGTFQPPLAPWPTEMQASVASRWLLGDLNGDGRADLVFVGPDADDGDPLAPNAREGSHLVVCGVLSRSALDPEFRLSPFVVKCQTTGIPAYQKYDKCQILGLEPSIFTSARDGFVVADLNGDGSRDLVRVGADLDVANCNSKPFPADATYQSYQAILSNGDGTFTVGDEFAPRLAQGPFVFVADIEGDGRDDLLVLRVVDNVVCVAGTPPGDDCAPQATVVQIRYDGVPGTAGVTAKANYDTPGLPYPWSAVSFVFGGPIYNTLDTLEVGDFDGDGHPEIAVWHRAYDNSHFLDDSGWFDENRTMPCAAATCPFYEVVFRVRTWQPGAEPIDGARWMTADVNGDGYPDYVKAEVSGNKLSLFVRLRRPGGGFDVLPTQTFSLPVGFEPAALHVADVNGDGLADLVAPRYDDGATAGAPPVLHVVTLLATGGGLFTMSEWSLDVPHRMPENAHWFTADTNGDGKANLVYISTTTFSDQACPRHVRLDVLRWSATSGQRPLGSRVPASLVSAWTLQPPADLPACAAGMNSPDWYVYDVDRNGTQDFVGVWPTPGSPVISYAVVSLLAGRDGSFRSVNAAVTSEYNYAPSRWTPIDLNGDGLPELGTVVNDIGDLNSVIFVDVLLSSGDGNVTRQRVYQEDSIPTSLARDFAFLDWNGDGRTDLVRLWFLDGNLSALQAASNGDRLVADAPFQVVDGAPYPDLIHLRALNVDGGLRQSLEYLAGGLVQNHMIAFTTAWYPAPRLVADLLVEIDEPLGTQTMAGYGLMTGASSTNDPMSGCRLPPTPGYLVSKVTVAPGGDPVSEEIQYGCPRYSPVERRLWAWRDITRTESAIANRPSRTTTESWDTDDQCGARLHSTQVTGGGSLQQVTLAGLPPGPAAPYHCETTASVAVDTDAAGTLTRSESFTYGEFGGVEEHQELGDTLRTGDERTTHVTYELAADPFIVTAATRDVHAGLGTAGPKLLQAEYCYDGVLCGHRATGRGLLTAERRFDDTSGSFVTVRGLGYDAGGNLTALTDANNATTTIDYEKTLALYPEVVRDVMGHATRLEWDLVLGEPTAVIDPNAVLLDARKYDALGRVVSIQTADHGLTTFDYRSWGLPTQSVFTTVADGSPSGLWSEARFDGLGRTTIFRQKASEAGPAYAFSMRYGDLSGNPKEVSHGFLEGAVGVPVETLAYDFLERLASIKHPDGSTLQTPTFALSASEIDELGHRRDFTYDAYGNVTSLKEAGVRTMTFDYDLLDRRTKIHDAGNDMITVVWDSLGRVVREEDPDLGVRAFDYDGAGNLTGLHDANSNVVTIAYDRLSRPVARAVNGSTVVTWAYDEPGSHGSSIGRLTSVIDNRSGCPLARSLAYDAMGRVTSETRCWDGISYTLGRQFDPLGRLAAITYPSAANRAPADGEVLVPTYDASGFPSTLPGIATSVHDPEGRLLSRVFANGITAAYTYDPLRDWLVKSAFHLLPGGTYGLTYKVAQDGSLTGVSSTVDSAYTLDGQHRLVRADQTLGSTTTTETFAYDNVGNMTKANADVYTYPPYGPGSRLVHAAQSAGQRTFAYDNAGNSVKVQDAGKDEQRFEWDGEGLLNAAETWDGAAWKRTEYAYDADGRRVKVHTPDGKITYDFFDEVEQDGAGRMVKRYFAGGDPVARRDGAGTLTYLHTDVLGSIRLVSSDTGTLVDRFEYGPFGQVEKGDVASSGGRGFTGARHDTSTALPGVPGSGLISLGARAYEPITRRFVSPDTVVPTLGTAEGLLRYAYALNSPGQLVDPSGHEPENVELGVSFPPLDPIGLPPGLASVVIHPASHPGLFNPAFSPQAGLAAIAGPATVGLATGLAISGGTWAYESANTLLLRGMAYIEATMLGSALEERASRVISRIFGRASVGTEGATAAAGSLISRVVGRALGGAKGAAAVSAAAKAIAQSVLRDRNKMNHIFGRSVHGLEGLTKALGSAENVVYAVAGRVAELGELPTDARGLYRVLVNVEGEVVQVTGRVMINGRIYMSDFWVRSAR